MSDQVKETQKDIDTLIDLVDRIIESKGQSKEAVIPILHALQAEYKYLPEEGLKRICEKTNITPANIYGVSTFYTQFRHLPVGDHIIHVCAGTACHVKGAERIYEAFFRELNIPKGFDTAPDGKFTLQRVACLGCCTLAPVVQIDGRTYGHVSSDGIGKVIDDFIKNVEAPPGISSLSIPLNEEMGEIRIGLGSCCIASGSDDVKQALESALQSSGVNPRLKRVGCVGMCHRVPLLEVKTPESEPVMYDRVKPEEVRQIVSRHFKPDTLYKRISNSAFQFFENMFENDPENGFSKHAIHVRDPLISVFQDPQHHIATEHAGSIDPLDLEEYRERKGFQALHSVLLNNSPDSTIADIQASGLRGRGGAGFPTADKWVLAKKAHDPLKYVICNGDEGDPGAFMDRMILESYPYRVIEGMIIAAFCIGAHQGFLYIRAEYPLAVSRINSAIIECQKAGLLGDNILNTGFSLDLQIMEGAGAFVCGEETALIASIEGKRGMPSYRPPYPVEKGLWGHPTLVNNCETYATVPWILRNGPEEFSKLGTQKSKGTKVFSLAGKIRRGGLIEVPMGITIREVVEVIGGGVEEGKQFKAVQIGGPSGGCVPAELAHTKVDYEDLLQVGAMMGSGGLLVLDSSDCMVDIARYFLTFTYSQSCGKCTHCRIGTKRMLDILEKLCAGKAGQNDLLKLEELAKSTQEGSLCGLGKTAPNPVLSTLKYFREEYVAHLKGNCPAGKCTDLIRYTINEDCIGCTICAQKCPVDAIPVLPYQQHEISQELCTKCDTCRVVCPHDAVEVG